MSTGWFLLLSPSNEVTDGSNSKWRLSQQLLEKIVIESASAFWFADHILSQGCRLWAAWDPNFNFLVLRRSFTSSVIIAVAPLWQVDIQSTIGLRRLRLVTFSFISLLSLLIRSPPLLFASPASTTRSWKDVQKSTNLGERKSELQPNWGKGNPKYTNLGGKEISCCIF